MRNRALQKSGFETEKINFPGFSGTSWGIPGFTIDTGALRDVKMKKIWREGLKMAKFQK